MLNKNQKKTVIDQANLKRNCELLKIKDIKLKAQYTVKHQIRYK